MRRARSRIRSGDRSTLARRLSYLAAVAASVALLHGMPTLAKSTHGEAAQAQSCTASLQRLKVGSRHARKTVSLAVRCNYLVDRIGFRTSTPIRKVRRAPTLIGSRLGDYFGCSRGVPPGLPLQRNKRDTVGGCSGTIAANTQARITISLKRSVCRPKRLRVRVLTAGGIDCRGSRYPCPLVGYNSNITKRVSGC